MGRWGGQAFADCVYVIAGAHGMVKIGVSADPAARLATLQTGSPHHLHLAHAALVNGDAYAAEADAHDLLAKYRQAGEWFAVPVDVAVAAVSAAVFRHSRPAALAPAPRPRWWLRYAVLTALAAPVWTFGTPWPFVGLMFTLIIWSSFRLIRYPLPFTGRLALRWAVTVAGALATSMLLAMPFVARAEVLPPIPDYDHTNYCENISAFMRKNEAVLQGCKNGEVQAKASLQRVWTLTPPELKTSCISMIELGTVGTYQGLGSCISLGVGKMWFDGKLELKQP